MKRRTAKYLIPLILFVVLLLDAHSTRCLTVFIGPDYLANVHVAILLLLVASKLLPNRFLLITTLVLGIIYDLYYVGVVGIYAVILPLIVFLVGRFSKPIHQNWLTMFFSMVIFVTFFELGSLALQSVFGLAHVATGYFVPHYLAPTLLVNSVLFVLLIFPVQRIILGKTARM